jgi:methionyl aminopeptidase
MTGLAHISQPCSWMMKLTLMYVPVARNDGTVTYLHPMFQLGREVLDIAGRAIRVGITTEEIDKLVHAACIERNCYPSPLNYYNFPKACCT